MRMWMVDPLILCRKHLLGEHGEIHKHLHNFIKQHSISGRIKGNAIEPLSLNCRHDQLAKEMVRRGYNHNSPLDIVIDFSYLIAYERNYKINRAKSLALLLDRCRDCACRYKELIYYI